MKKREPVKQKDNVIFFPELEKHLTKKGFESLQMKNFTEAIDLLEKASELDPENGDILIGLVLAYFEAGSFLKAKELARDMLLKGVGDYFQMVDLYLTILIQLHEYSEIVATIEALLDEKEIPPEKNEHFLTILQFSRRMAENPSGRESAEIENSKPLNLNLISVQDPKEQLLLITSLADKNIRSYIIEVKEYLLVKTGHPFLKTMLLNLLKEQEYDQKVMIEKFNMQKDVTPIELPEIGLQPEMMKIKKIVKEKLENTNPVLYENIKSLVERHFFITYPFCPEPFDLNAWAAAFHSIVLEYYGSRPDLLAFSEDYNVEKTKIAQALAWIKEIEEISYPII